MSQFRSCVAIWTTDPARPEITQQGELLACGPVKDVIETAARPIPAWVTIAGFADDDTPKKWFESVEDQVDGTALLFPAHPEPVWWPPEREGDRPEWSGRLSPPQERLGVFVSVWADITHLEPFLDYAQHFKWTVEHHGGASLGRVNAYKREHVRAVPHDGRSFACGSSITSSSTRCPGCG
jgi:hypothetical protein